MAITISGDSPNFTSVAATTVNGVTTLNSSSGVLATQNGMTGIAKAWVNFNGTGTVAIRNSFNVSSITDNGTGNYTINFSTSMPNTNYCVTGISDVALNTDNNPRSINFIAFNTGSLQISTIDNSGVKEDSAYVNVAVFSS